MRKTIISKMRISIKGQEIIQRNQTEILDLKSTIAEMKNSLEGFNNRFKWAEEKKPINSKIGKLSLQIKRKKNEGKSAESKGSVTQSSKQLYA